MKKKKKNAFEEGEPLKLKQLVLYIKIFMYVMLSIMAVCLFAYLAGTIYSTVSYCLNSAENVKADEVTINFLSNINSYDKDYVLELIDDYDTSKVEFVFIEIVFPALVTIAIIVILSRLCEKILKFVKKVKTDNDIFNDDNLIIFRKCREPFIITCCLLVVFNNEFSIILGVLLELGYEIILYLLNYIVKQKKNEVE